MLAENIRWGTVIEGLGATHPPRDLVHDPPVRLRLTGGLQNPFSLLFLAPVLISATALPPERTLALGLSSLTIPAVPLLLLGGTPTAATAATGTIADAGRAPHRRRQARPAR